MIANTLESRYVVPQWQLGYLSPLPVVDAMHYEFYQIAPSGVTFIACPLLIDAFDEQSALDAVLGRSGAAMDYLCSRGANRIIFGGIPVSVMAGREIMLGVMRAATQRLSITVSSDLEDTIDALRHLSVRRVVVAAKWKPPVMQAVVRYLEHAGIAVEGVCGADFDAKEVMQVNTSGSVGLALQLGRQALSLHPESEALLLGGGTWLSVPATQILEHEFRKPVVSNMVACVWAALREFGCKPSPNVHCRLLIP
jgi:maleate cis-trans isomerase